jgi:hypothetical protein
MSELSRTLSRSKAALARNFTGQPHRCSFQPIARITSDPTEMVGYHDRIPWSDTMIGVVFLAALLLLALAIYVVVRRKPASEELQENNAADDAMIASPDPGDAAFDAAFAKHIAPHTDKYFSTRIAGASEMSADGIRRLATIEKCEPMELLRLELDPDRRQGTDEKYPNVWEFASVYHWVTFRLSPVARHLPPRNTRYQAAATPYLGRTCTGWNTPACLAHGHDT